MSCLRVAFAGTPAFAAAALQAVIDAGHVVPLVLTQPDRPAGRGLKLQASPVKTLALGHGLPVAQPAGLRLDGRHAADAADAGKRLREARPQVLVVAAYGLILPRWVLDLPLAFGDRGCLNIHASLLPRWRGAAPIQRAIEAGDASTGITIMAMDEGLDTGDMLLSEALTIAADDTAATLHDRLAALGAGLIVRALAADGGAALPRWPQPPDGVTYARKIEKSESSLEWSATAVQLERRIRAFDPFPGAAVTFDTETVKVWRAEVLASEGEPGRVLAHDDDGPVVACGQGSLRLTVLQRPGGRRLPARQALQGMASWAGSRLVAD